MIFLNVKRIYAEYKWLGTSVGVGVSGIRVHSELTVSPGLDPLSSETRWSFIFLLMVMHLNLVGHGPQSRGW